MRPFSSTSRKPERRLSDYYSSDKDLYRVEHVVSDRALVEDCRTGVLIDVPVEYLERLRPVQRDRRAAA